MPGNVTADSLGIDANPAYNLDMRMRVVVLLVLAAVTVAACAYSDHYPFHTIAPSGPASTSPPGVRMALYLDGVHEVPNRGVPVRSYELRIELEQDPDVPQWRPSLEHATLRDDEGNEIPVSAWFVDAAKSKSTGLERYRCVFELKRPYRFQSIMGATVFWKLVSHGSPEFRITSKFQQ